MALVRCSCVTQLSIDDAGRRDLVVQLVDPTCGYVVHRLGSELADLPPAR